VGYGRLDLAVGRCRGERVYLPVVFAQ